MDTTIAAALIAVLGTLLVYLFKRWNEFDWMTVMDKAIRFARRYHFEGSEVIWRNSKRRWLGWRLSIMLDVFGRHYGVYLMFINRKGTILKIVKLPHWRPRR